MALAEDSPLTGRQSNTLITRLLATAEHRDSTWDWVTTNFEPYVTRKVPDVRIGGVPGAGRNFCTLARRDDVLNFMEANATLIPGYERSLAQTVERIELCAALKAAQSEALVSALAAR